MAVFGSYMQKIGLSSIYIQIPCSSTSTSPMHHTSPPTICVMVNVLGVELGRPLLTVSTAVPTSDIFAMVASEAGIPEEELLIFNSEGLLIDPKQDLSTQTLEDSDLFAIRNNNVSCDVKSVHSAKDWKTFKNFPAHDAYEEPFPFDSATDAEVEGLQETERLLFALTLKARCAYALYIMHMRRYDKIARMLEIRAKACPVLLKSVKLYYKQVHYHCRNVSGKLQKLKLESIQRAETFKPRLQELAGMQHLAPYIQRILSNSSFKNYGKHYSASLRSLESKLIEVEKLLEATKKSIREKMTKAKNRTSTLTRFLQGYFGAETRCKEPIMAAALNVCAAYRSLRTQLNEAVRCGHRRIDSSESDIEDYQDQVEAAERIVTELDDFGRQEKEESTRITMIFKETVAECADKANRLKLRGKDKLVKIERKLARLEEGKDMLDFPCKFASNCEAALCEMERRKATSLYFTDMYAELCWKIDCEEERKREFQHNYGPTLPAQLFPELEQPSIPSSTLHKLLNYDSTDILSKPSLFTQLEPRFQHTILHYEGELRQSEVQQTQELHGLHTRCQRLEQDLAELTALIDRCTSEKQGLIVQLQTYSAELGELREAARGSQLRVLRTELDRLQKKEAAFKEGWVEQVQSLEMEVRLLRSRERKKSRPDVSELSKPPN